MALSSDDSDTEDDFVVLGTPLPDLDETQVTKKPITVQDLTATDKEGRRRFHGAFTGGFSAGYFNTVGSKEGFIPSSFISSRSQNNDEGQQSRPEDFMDDEDLEEHGIAPRKFTTSGNYTSEERKRKLEDVAKQLTQSSALEFGGAFNDLVVPEYLPIGIKLLKKMGWREGQGLGPRVKRNTRKGKSKRNKDGSKGKKVYGCALPPSDSDSDDSDSYIPSSISDLTFAPSDVSPIMLNTKDDVKGLGYRGLDPSLALPGSRVSQFGNPIRGKRRGKGIMGQAFGVGALEDDDDDIYVQDSLSNYDLTMRGHDDDDDQDGNFGWTAPRTHAKQKLPLAYVGKLLEGFCLSSKPLQSKKKFPPPKLLADFKSHHWSRRRKKDSVDDKQNKMTAIDRGLMLGEKPIMNSVFDLVGSKDKSRMESAKEAIEMTKSLDTSSGIQPEKGLDTEKNHQSKFLSRFTEAQSDTINEDKSVKRTSNTSLFKGSLQPFLKDPPKQARFDQYLTAVQQKVPDPYSQVSNQQMTEWEKSREQDEFSRSARLFKPMSAAMSSRFVQGAMLDDKNQDSKMEPGGEVSDEVKAAEMRMFGKLTRQQFEWHPDKLICKRFNVPNPYPGSDIVGLPTIKRDKFSVFNFLSFENYQPRETEVNLDQTEKDHSKKSEEATQKRELSDRSGKKKVTLSSIFKVLDDPDFHKTPMADDSSKPNKSSMEQSTEHVEGQGEEDQEEKEETETDLDLFRAIFRNSDSEVSEDDRQSVKDPDSMSDEEEDDRKKDVDENHSVIPVNDSVLPANDSVMPVNNSVISANDSVIHANDSNAVAEQNVNDVSDSEYGPLLPPASISGTVNTASEVKPLLTEKLMFKVKEKDRHSEKHKVKKEKKKKSKHKSRKEKKHKKSKKSSKTKKSKRDSRASEADSESRDEDSDDSDVSDTNLLNRFIQVSKLKSGKH